MPQGVNGLRKLRTTVIRHFPAGKNLSKKPDGRAPSGLRVRQEKQKTFHAKSQSSLRKGDRIPKKGDNVDSARVLSIVESSRQRHIGVCLRRSGLDLNHANVWRTGCVRLLEVQFQRFLKIRDRLFFGLTLTCNTEFQTLGDVPIFLAPNSRSERSLHIRYCCKYGSRASCQTACQVSCGAANFGGSCL